MDGGTLDDRTLRRIIAMLVGLSVLAERAGARSFPVRWFVLTLLRHAEAVARDFVVETIGWAWQDLKDQSGSAGDPGGPLGSGNSPADAMALARRLRSLAALLRAVLPFADFIDRENLGAGGGFLVLALHLTRLSVMPVNRTQPVPDTS